MSITTTGTKGRGKIYGNIIETLGNTPLVRLNKLGNNASANILLKLEFFNPLGSLKDRIGAAIIADLEQKGKINKDTNIVEATSGNTGIALAFVCAAKGYKLTLVMPESMSIERRKMLSILGAEVKLTPADKGMIGAIKRANEIVAGNKNAILAQQFDNPANPEIHEITTGPEIWNDTKGDVDCIVVGVGTGGTLTGTARYLKKKNPKIKIIAVEPEDSPILSGGEAGPHKIQGIGAGFVPNVLDESLIDQILTIGNQTALMTARRIAATDGIPVGISSGAVIAAALEVAENEEMTGKNIVVIIPSFAERYLTTVLFEDFK